MVAQFAQRAERVLTRRADAHGPVRLHHHSGAAGLPRAVDHVGHEVQGGLEQQTVVAGKQFLVHELLHLEDTDAGTLVFGGSHEHQFEQDAKAPASSQEG